MMDFKKVERWLVILLYVLSVLLIVALNQHFPDEQLHPDRQEDMKSLISLFLYIYLSTFILISFCILNYWVLKRWCIEKDFSKAFLRIVASYLVIFLLGVLASFMGMWEESKYVTFWFQFVHQLNSDHIGEVFASGFRISGSIFVPLVEYIIVKAIINELLVRLNYSNERVKEVIKNTFLFVNFWVFFLYLLYNISFILPYLFVSLWVYMLPYFPVVFLLLIYWVYQKQGKKCCIVGILPLFSCLPCSLERFQ